MVCHGFPTVDAPISAQLRGSKPKRAHRERRLADWQARVSEGAGAATVPAHSPERYVVGCPTAAGRRSVAGDISGFGRHAPERRGSARRGRDDWGASAVRLWLERRARRLAPLRDFAHERLTHLEPSNDCRAPARRSQLRERIVARSGNRPPTLPDISAVSTAPRGSTGDAINPATLLGTIRAQLSR